MEPVVGLFDGNWNLIDNYFRDEFVAYSIILGLLWVVMWMIPQIIVSEWVTPAWTTTALGLTVDIVGSWTKIAWHSIAYGGDIIYGALTVFWVLGYGQMSELQMVYYKAIVWLMPATWAQGFGLLGGPAVQVSPDVAEQAGPLRY